MLTIVHRVVNRHSFFIFSIILCALVWVSLNFFLMGLSVPLALVDQIRKIVTVTLSLSAKFAVISIAVGGVFSPVKKLKLLTLPACNTVLNHAMRIIAVAAAATGI